VGLRGGGKEAARHESDYYLHDHATGHHHLIELKIGGDLDNKKARSEKQALLEQYAILCNTLGSADNVSIRFATAYNRFGEGAPWRTAFPANAWTGWLTRAPAREPCWPYDEFENRCKALSQALDVINEREGRIFEELCLAQGQTSSASTTCTRSE
jgi:hypothetical protein